jgi:hypothetical protein
MKTNNVSGSKVRRVRKADNLTPSVSRLSRQCGILNISQAYRPPRPVTGITLLCLIFLAVEDEILCDAVSNRFYKEFN